MKQDKKSEFQKLELILESNDIETYEEINEGILDVLKGFNPRKFRFLTMEKGKSTVFFVQVKDSQSMGKVIFENGSLQDKVRYNSNQEMELDIEAMKADGFVIQDKLKFKRIAKMVLRNLGKLAMYGGGFGFVIAPFAAALAVLGSSTIAGAAAASGISFLGIGIGTYALTFLGGWAVASLTKEKDALTDVMGKEASDSVQSKLRESIINGDYSSTIREVVRETMKSYAEQIGDLK